MLLNTLMSRIPGLREQVPTTVNTLGEEKTADDNVTRRLLNAMLNPLGVNEYTQSDVSKEMQRVREETGIKDFYPTTRKPKELSYKKNGETVSVTLSYEQRQQFQAAASAAQMSVTANLIGSGVYKSATPTMQAALLERADTYAYEYAKAAVLGNDAVDKWVLNAQTSQRDIGVSMSEYFYLYEKYGSSVFSSGDVYEKTKRMVGAGLTVDQWAKMKTSMDTNGSGSINKEELTTYIEANFPAENWSAIFDAYKGGSNWKNPY